MSVVLSRRALVTARGVAFLLGLVLSAAAAPAEQRADGACAADCLRDTIPPFWAEQQAVTSESPTPAIGCRIIAPCRLGDGLTIQGVSRIFESDSPEITVLVGGAGGCHLLGGDLDSLYREPLTLSDQLNVMLLGLVQESALLQELRTMTAAGRIEVLVSLWNAANPSQPWTVASPPTAAPAGAAATRASATPNVFSVGPALATMFDVRAVRVTENYRVTVWIGPGSSAAGDVVKIRRSATAGLKAK